MLKSLRKLSFTVAAVLALAVPMLAPTVAFAADPPDVNTNLGCGVNLQIDSATSDCSTAGGTSQIQKIITTGLNLFSVVVGLVAVVMIIVGGFKYITSGGDSGNISSAKSTIMYAIIGLVIVALAQFFVQFVLNKVTT